MWENPVTVGTFEDSRSNFVATVKLDFLQIHISVEHCRKQSGQSIKAPILSLGNTTLGDLQYRILPMKVTEILAKILGKF